jgi:hypothetical protein
MFKFFKRCLRYAQSTYKIKTSYVRNFKLESFQLIKLVGIYKQFINGFSKKVSTSPNHNPCK